MNKNATLIAVIVVVLVLVAGGYLYLQSKKTTAPTEPIQVIRDTSPSSSSTTNTTQVTPAESTPSDLQSQNTITLSSSGFSPSTLTVKAGTKVIWLNKSGAQAAIDSDPHPAHTSYLPLNLGRVQDGADLSLVFTTAGTYHYHNHLNASQTGTVVVQ